MNPDEYRDSPAGRLVRAGNEPTAYWAFVPNPLPPRLDFDLALARLNGEAERALGELAGLGRSLENPTLLARPLIRREAVLSSRIEGTQAGLAELYVYEAGQQLELPGVEASATDTDAREVLNYVRALEYGIKRVEELPVSYQFEAIHPFVDGNGRIGRLLLSLLLIEWGLLPLPLLHLSAFFEQNRDAYYDGLAAVTRQGAWRDWVAYFLSGVREQSGDAVRRLKELQDLLVSWKAQLRTVKPTPLMLHIVDTLPSEPQISALWVARRFGVTHPTANKALRALEELGIIKELTGMRRGRIYCATDVIGIFT